MATNRPFSYRLKMEVEPQWAEIIKRVVGLEDEKEQKTLATTLRITCNLTECSIDAMILLNFLTPHLE
jgi:hypothetical protein